MSRVEVFQNSPCLIQALSANILVWQNAFMNRIVGELSNIVSPLVRVPIEQSPILCDTNQGEQLVFPYCVHFRFMAFCSQSLFNT